MVISSYLSIYLSICLSIYITVARSPWFIMTKISATISIGTVGFSVFVNGVPQNPHCTWKSTLQVPYCRTAGSNIIIYIYMYRNTHIYMYTYIPMICIINMIYIIQDTYVHNIIIICVSNGIFLSQSSYFSLNPKLSGFI